MLFSTSCLCIAALAEARAATVFSPGMELEAVFAFVVPTSEIGTETQTRGVGVGAGAGFSTFAPPPPQPPLSAALAERRSADRV
jgi:hypothetical protein